jgi:signal transduction histidine kinase
MTTMIGHEERLRQLIEAGIALGSELSLDELLRRIAETAAAITGARYAALGVIDQEGRSLERFITIGVDAETEAHIGSLPTGRGILGVLIGEAAPLRLHDLGDDPRSVGFPPGHPPMHTFLGVPIMLRGVAYGNLYLTEKVGAESFTAADEELVTLLASQAAVGIENARLHEASVRWIRQLESLADVSNALVDEMELPKLLDLIVSRLRILVDGRVAMAYLPDADGRLRVVAADGEGAAAALDLSVERHTSKPGKVMTRRRSERIDSVIDDPEFDQTLGRRLASTTALLVPLVATNDAIGVLAVHDRLTRSRRFDDGDLRLAEAFASRAAVAIELSRRVERDSLQAILRGQEDERRRLARELHDETGQALTAILLGLRAVREAPDGDAIERAADELNQLAVSALEDVRRLAFELRPKALDDFGLAAALERLAESIRERSGMAVELEVAGVARLDDDHETAVYRVVQEALTNVVKHAQAGTASIVVAQRNQSVTVVVEDDGRGFVTGPSDRFGLVAMRERLGLLGGSLRVESENGRGTTVHATIPLA